MVRRHAGWLLMALLVSGCALSPPRGSGRTPVADDGRMASLEMALADALIQIEKMKARSDGDALPKMPANAQTGACYARMLQPPQYVEREASRMVKEATETLQMQPAKTEWREEQVVVSEAHTQLKLVPATYKWLEEKTLVLPARERQELVSEAEYETVTEQVLVAMAETVWRKGRGEIERIDEESGEIVHRVELPAKYRDVERQLLRKPAVYRRVVEPAVYETLRKRVVDQPEHSVAVQVPAVYKTVRVQRIVEPARVTRIPVPAVYERYSYREKVADESLVWRQIVCQRDLSEERLRTVQKALQARGFEPGYADGILGKRTQAAVYAFQQQQGLATGRLSVETLQALQLPAP